MHNKRGLATGGGRMELTARGFLLQKESRRQRYKSKESRERRTGKTAQRMTNDEDNYVLKW